MLGDIAELLLTGKKELDHDELEGNSKAGDDGAQPSEAKKVALQLSEAQTNRLRAQGFAVLDMLEEERVRDLVIISHLQTATKAFDQLAADSTADAVEATNRVVFKCMDEASILRLTHSAVLIAEKVALKSEGTISPRGCPRFYGNL